jgi:putative ABC transport system permease protein
MTAILQDVRFAFRMVRKNPGFTAIVVLTLGLGIGSNATVYSTARTFLLAPLPGLREPDRLVRLVEVPPQRDEWAGEASPGSFFAWRRQASAFEGLAACNWWLANVTGSTEPERILGIRGTANYFAVLGFEPALGRGFLPGEDQPGRDGVAVLGDGLWRRRYGADRGVIGKTISLNSRGYTIVGVMPPEHTYPEGGQVWVPRTLRPESAADFADRSLIVFARLKRGVSIADAQAELSGIAARMARDHPSTNAGWGLQIWSLEGFQARLSRPYVVLLMAAVGFVLLIVCANVASLLLARASARQREFALRSALGAGRLRMFRQRLTESLLLALLGGALGVLFARWEIALLRGALPGELTRYIPAWHSLGVDGRVLGFTALLTLAVGLVFGTVPALSAARPNLQESLKDGGRGSSTGGRGSRLRKVLVVSEMALALMLLASTGLMVQSFAHLLKSRPGFRTDHLLTMQITLPAAPAGASGSAGSPGSPGSIGSPGSTGSTGSKYRDTQARAAFYTDLSGRVRALPGVRAIALVNGLPLSGWDDVEEVEIAGRPANANEKPSVGYRVVSESWFAAMEIPLSRGRSFGSQDHGQAQGVAIVNEAMAKAIWPGVDPLAQRIRIAAEPGARAIVGVVRNIRSRGLGQPARSEVYVPLLQAAPSSMAMVVRTAGDPAALAGDVQRQIAAMDPALAAGDVRPFERVLERNTAPFRLTTAMLAGFALLALLLSGIGIYGVISFAVASRTQEIGVRVALGAQRRDVLGLVVGQGARLVAVGMGIGLAGALALTRAMASMLFGVSPTDLVSFAAASIVLAVVALFGSYLPALKAADLDPLTALRSE